MTPIDHGDVCLNIDKKWFASHGHRSAEDARGPDDAALPQAARRREPRHLDAGARVHARDRRPVRRERLAGLLEPAARERRARRRRLGGGVHDPVLGCRRQQGQPADRRLLRDEPGRRGDLREAEAARRPTAVVADSCFRQIELAGVLAGAKNVEGAQRADRLHALRAIPGAVPESMFVLPVRNGHAASGRRSGGMPSRRRARSSFRRRRSGATATAGSTSGHRPSCAETRLARRHRRRAGGLRRALLRVPAGRDPRARAHLGRRAVAARREPPACSGSRPGRRRRRPRSRSPSGFRSRGRSGGSGSAAARSRARSCWCRSCCRRSSSRRRF